MKSSFSTPEFTSGVTSAVPETKPNTEDRTWGEFATDVAIDAVASPLVGAIRTGTQAWRMAEDNAPTPRAVDQALGATQDWLKEHRSDRARALDTQSIDPRGDERSFWKEPVAGSIHAFLPSIPYAAAALATAGSSIPVQAGAAAASGAAQMGDALNDLRDYADNTKLAELRKSPVFEKFYREFDGDEIAARNALFKEMLDPKSQALNFLVNTFEVPAFRLGMRPSGTAMRIVDRVKAAGIGAGVGGTQGAIEGGTEAYIGELGKVRSGQQQAIQTDEIASGALKGAVQAGPMAAFHAIAPTYKTDKNAQQGTLDDGSTTRSTDGWTTGTITSPDGQTRNMTPEELATVKAQMDAVLKRAGGNRAAPLGTTEADVADQQINPQQEQPPTPPGQRPPRQRGPVTDVEEQVAPPGEPPLGEPPPAAAPPEPRPAPDVSEAVSIFKTAKGSEYFVMPDGTTIRNKAPRPEHPGDQGWQEPSQRTLYLSPEHANELGGLFQATTTFGKRIAMLPDGRVGIQYMQGPSAGKFERRTVGRPLDGPQAGALPVELWRNGARAHFGNPITEVAHRPGTQRAAPQGEQFGPPTEPEGPQLQPPPRMPLGRRVWSSEQGFSAPVNVMDRPPVFQNGQWMQPVAYTNPRTGQTQEMLAPIDELQEPYGPPGQRPPAPPPVQTPEQPLAPQFPEVERPGAPSPEEYGGEPMPEYKPEQMTQVDYDLIRGGIALWDDDTRKKIGDKLEAIAKERPPTVEDVPGVLRNQLDREQYAAFAQAMEKYPADLIENIRQVAEPGLARSPALLDLQERFRRQREQERAPAEQPAAQPDTTEALVGEPYRRGVEATQQERDLVHDIAEYKARPQTQGDWIKLHQRARRADEARARGGVPAADFEGTFDAQTAKLIPDGTTSFEQLLGPRPVMAGRRRRNIAVAQTEQLRQGERRRAEVQADMQRVMARRQTVGQKIIERRQREHRERDEAARKREAAMRPPPEGMRAVRTQAEEILARAVQSYNERARNARNAPLMSKEKRLDLEAERRNLERRAQEFNATAEARGLKPLQVEGHLEYTVKPPTKKQVKEQRGQALRKEFAATVERLKEMARQGELVKDGKPNPVAQNLVRRMESVRGGIQKITGGQGYPDLTPEFRQHLANAGLLQTPEQQRTAAAREREAGSAMSERVLASLRQRIEERIRAKIEGRGAKGAAAAKLVKVSSELFGEWRARDIRSVEGRLFRTNKDGTKTWIGGKQPATGREGNFKRTRGAVSRQTAADREAWDTLSPTEKRELRAEGLTDRVIDQREIEEIVRDLVTEYEAKARESVAQNKPPLIRGQPALEGEKQREIPTQAEAIRRAREHLAKEEGRAAQRTATGKVGEEGTRGRDFQQREDIIKSTMTDAVAKRLGVGKRYADFIGRLTNRTVPVKFGEGTHQVSLLGRPRMPDSLANLGDRPMTDRHRELQARWEADVAAWLKGKDAKVEAAEKLKKDIDHVLKRIEDDLAAHARTKRGEGSITWHLPTKIWDQKQQRYIFRAGVSSPNTAYYNFANDLQKVSEELRYMLVGLGKLKPEKQQVIKRAGEPEPVRQPKVTRADMARMRQEAGVPQRVLTLQEQIKQIINPSTKLRPGKGATLARSSVQGGMRGEGMAASQTRTRVASAIDEYARYTTPLDNYMQEFVANLDLAQKGQEGMKLLEEGRQMRSKEVTEARGISARRLAGEMTEAELGRFEARELTGTPSRLGVHPDEVVDRDTGEYRAAPLIEDATERGLPAPGIGASDVAGLEQIEKAYEPSTGQGIVKGARRAAETRSINIVEDAAIAAADDYLRRQEARERAEFGDDYDRVIGERRAAARKAAGLRSASLKYTGKVRPGLPDFDEKGLPVDRLPPHEEFTPYNEEEQRYLDAHDQINNDPAPTHGLISEPEGTQATVDRIKQMAADGHTSLVPTEYITHDFLDRLAAITADTEVLHAPYDAVSGIDEDGPAHYNTIMDRVVLSNDVSPDLYVRSALHETVHAVTERSLLTDPVLLKDTQDLMQLAIKAAERRGINPDRLPRDFGGLTDASEFITEVTSNKKFRQFLFTVPAPHNAVIQGAKNVLNAVYHAIRQALRRVFGNAKDGDTALDVLFYDQSTVLGQADALVRRTVKQLEKRGRPSREAAHQALEGDGRRYLSLSEGARAFRDGLGEMFGRAAFQANQIKTENRAPGMGWRTVFDQTKIGGPEFKRLTAEFHETFERMHGTATRLKAEDKKELDELGRIWTGWNAEGRKMAGEMMIAEGEHTAFADAPLGEYGPEYLDQATGERKRDLIGKNAHIDPTLLKNAQVVEQHEEMQRRLQQAIDRLPPMAAVGKRRGHGGFKEFRERVYAFTSKREEDIRRNNIRDTWAVSDHIPDNLPTKEREALLDALRDWTDLSAKLSTADQARLRKAGFFNNDDAKEWREKIRASREFQGIQGPYSPFTRYGDWALSGTFKIDTPKNALMLKEDIDETTGQPVTEARYVFPTEEEAREMVREMSKEENGALVQLDGGKVWIDTRTGERPRVPDKRHAGKQRLATTAEIERAASDEKGIDPGLAKALDPEHMEQYSFVTFQPKLLTMEPDQYTAHQNMLAFKQKYGDKLDITKPKDVYQHDGRQNDHYTSTHMQNLINAVRASTAYQRLDENEQAALTRQMNLASEKFTQRRGFKQRYLPRNYVKGPTTHVLASLDDYSTTSTRYLAKVEHSAPLKDQSEAIKTYLKDHEYEQGNANFVAENRVYQALMHRTHNPTRNPHDNFINRSLDRGLRITTMDKLPNVGYVVINATETTLVGGPLMTGRHSATKVYPTIAKYYKIAGVFGRFRKAAANDIAHAFRRDPNMTNFVDLFNDALDQAGTRAPFAEGQKRLIQRAADRSLFDRNASLEYQSSFPTNRKWIDVALDYMQGLFQAVNTAIENMGRFATLTSAYDLEMRRLIAVANGKEREHNPGEAQYTTEQRDKAASDYAVDMLHQANGVYLNYNAPHFFTREGPLGALGPVIFQFKKWPQRITMIYMRAGLGMVEGIFKDWAQGNRMTPEHREAARQFVAMIAMVGLMSGAAGLPLEPFSHTVNLAYMMGLSKYNWDDVQAGFRDWVGRKGGRDLAQLVQHGPLSYFTGLDIGRRLAQSDMWASGSPASNKPRDLNASLMTLLGGAMLGTANETLGGLQKWADSARAASNGADDVAAKKFFEGLRQIVPIRLVSDAIAAATGGEGVELTSGRKLGQPPTLYERAGRALGFTPTREAEAREGRAAITSAEKRSNASRKALIDDFTRSPPGAQREAQWATIQRDWNPYHPGFEITREDLLKADQSLKKARSERDTLGIAQNRRNKALMPMAEMYGYR